MSFPFSDILTGPISEIFRDVQEGCFGHYESAVQNLEELATETRMIIKNTTGEEVLEASARALQMSGQSFMGNQLFRYMGRQALSWSRKHGHEVSDLLRDSGVGRPITVYRTPEKKLTKAMLQSIRAYLDPSNIYYSPFGTEHMRRNFSMQ